MVPLLNHGSVTEPSEPDKGLDQFPEQTIETELARHRNQAKALLVAADDRRVIDAVVAKIEVAGCVAPSCVREVADQDARHFDS